MKSMIAIFFCIFYFRPGAPSLSFLRNFQLSLFDDGRLPDRPASATFFSSPKNFSLFSSFCEEDHPVLFFFLDEVCRLRDPRARLIPRSFIRTAFFLAPFHALSPSLFFFCEFNVSLGLGACLCTLFYGPLPLVDSVRFLRLSLDIRFWQHVFQTPLT